MVGTMMALMNGLILKMIKYLITISIALMLMNCKKDNPVQHAECNDGSMFNVGNCDSVCATKGGVKYCYK